MIGLTRRNGDTSLARPQGTEIGRCDPWSEFNRIRNEMDRLFGGFFGPTPPWTEGISTFTPAVDLYETVEEVGLNVYLPGISREDIHVEVVGDTIHITGESKPTVPEKATTVHQVQGGCGKFDLRYSLPVEVNVEQVKATYRSGVLEVRLPKAEAARPKPVAVRIEG